MKVTVIVTSYNYEDYIAPTVNSVLNQDYGGEIECIVVDDGSTDHSVDKLAEFGNSIKLINQDNAGQCAAINAGFAASTGDIICYLDSDDLWAKDKVRRITEIFEQNPSVGMVYHSLILIGRNGELVDRNGVQTDRPVIIPSTSKAKTRNLRRKLLINGLDWSFTPSVGISFNRYTLNSVMPLPETIKSEADALSAIPAALLKPVLFVAEPLGFYRLHGKNASVTAEGRALDGHPAKRQNRAKRDIEHLSALWTHANQVLINNGHKGELDVNMSWHYIKASSNLLSKPPAFFIPKAIGAIMRCKELTSVEKIAASARLASRALERTITGNWKK